VREEESKILVSRLETRPLRELGETDLERFVLRIEG
jgi:polyribonucleotide nucleotidyltransferase